MSSARLSAAGLAALGFLACGSPAAPDLAPAQRAPGAPAANTCEPVGSPFANRAFHLQDFAAARACRVYLEQDECVVGIWDDCTVQAANARRSWEGRVDLSAGQATTIWLRSRSRAGQVPVGQCWGVLELEAEVPRAALDCESTQDGLSRLYLERVLDPPVSLAPVRSRLDTGGTTVEDLAVFDGTDGRRVLAAVSGLAREMGGGLHLFREDEGGQLQRVDVRVEYGYLVRVAASTDGRYLIAGGAADLFALDLERGVVLGHRALTGGRDDRYAGLVGTGPNEAVVALRRSSAARTEWQRYRLDPFEPIGPEQALEDAQLERLVAAAPGPGAPLLMVVARDEGGRVLALDRASLAVVGTYPLPSREQLGFAPGPSEREAIFADPQGFAMLFLGTGLPSPYLPLPYFSRPTAVAYDPERDWILAAGGGIAGNPGYVYAIERALGRPIPRGLELPKSPLALAVHRGVLFVAEENRIHEVPLPTSR